MARACPQLEPVFVLVATMHEGAQTTENKTYKQVASELIYAVLAVSCKLSHELAELK